MRKLNEDVRSGGVVLLVEDDESVQRINRRVLERAGYAVACAATLEEAWRCLHEQPPDVIVLDIMMPDGSGLVFCEKVRPLTPAPVLFLTALDGKGEEIEGLRAGGNDYISKPYDVDVLVARVEAQLRLARSNRVAQSRTLVQGSLVLDLAAQHAYVHGRDLLLTPKEFALLLLFVQHERRVLGADEVYRTVWRRPLAHDAVALKSAVYRLRKKLAGSGCTVTARRGEGYVFEASEE